MSCLGSILAHLYVKSGVLLEYVAHGLLLSDTHI